MTLILTFSLVNETLMKLQFWIALDFLHLVKICSFWFDFLCVFYFCKGFDLSTEKGYTQFVCDFDRIVGMKYLKAMHLNDSKGTLYSLFLIQ